MIRPRSLRIACLLPLALASCLGSYERAVEETRAGLIGKTGRELRACLGVPTDFDREGDVEILTYRWVWDPRKDLRVGSGGIGGIVIGRGSIGGGGDPLGFPRDAEEESYCQIVFQLDASGVTEVTAVGRDEVGLGANSECMQRARHCVDDDYLDE
jgi:hypothetical protein